MSGFFEGGMAEGMNTAAEQGIKRDTLAQDTALRGRGLDIQQQTATNTNELGKSQLAQTLALQTRQMDIQQQAQSNAEKRDVLGRADAQIAETMKLVSDATQAMIDQGANPNTIAQKVQPLLQSAKSLATKAGRDPSSLDAALSVMLTRPPAPPTFGKTGGGGLVDGDQYGFINPRTQTITPAAPAAAAAPPPTTAPAPTATAVPAATAPDPNAPVDPNVNPSTPAAVPAPAPTESASTYRPSTNPMILKLIDAGVIDHQTLDLRAKQALLGDKSAMVGYGNSKLGVAIKNAIQTRTSEMAIQDNMSAADLNSRKAETNAAGQSLAALVKQKNSIEAFEETAVKNGDILVDLAKKVDTTGKPVIERWLRAGQQSVAGDADVSAFNAQMTLYRTEVAKILTSPGLTGVLSDDARHEIERALPSASNVQQIETVHNLLKGDFKRRSAAIDEQIAKVKKSFDQPRATTAAPPAATAPPPATQVTAPPPAATGTTPSGLRFKVVQ